MYGVLVDTSVWVEHFRRGNPTLVERLEEGDVLCHEFVIGELACGNLARRDEVLVLLNALARTPTAEHDEVLSMLNAHRLAGSGIGWMDAHLLASALLTRSTLWTLDRRLAEAARDLRVAAEF